MEAADKRLHPTLLANYVTLVDLRERWMQRQKQKERDDVNGDRDLQRNVEVGVDQGAKGEEGKGVGEDDQLEQKQQPLGKSVVRSNPNPNPANQRAPRWGQISQPKPPPLPPLNQPKQKPVFPRVRTIQTKPAPVVQVVEAKPPPFDAAKVESVVRPREGHSSGNKVDDQKLGGPKVEEKKKIVPQRNYKDGEFHSPGKAENKLKWNSTRNHEKQDVVQSQPERVVLDPNGDGEDKNIGFLASNVSKNVEIEGKFAGVSLSSRIRECSGGRSVVVRNRNGWIKGRQGGFEGRKKRESGSGLVWVKKGEASNIDDAPNF